MGTDTNQSSPASSTTQTGGKAGWILLGAAAVLAAGSIGYNVYDGRSGDEPAEQAEGELPSLDELREAAEASEDDARPWTALGFAHFERGEYADAAQAYQRAVEIDDGEAVLWSALGEALAFASERDPLPPAALEAFGKAIELDPGDPRARYFMALKLELILRHH